MAMSRNGLDLSRKRSRAGSAGARARWDVGREPPRGIEHLRMTKSAADVATGQRQVWYRIQNAKTDNPVIHILDEIGFFGINASDLVHDLSRIDADNITVNINSPGGSVFEGLAIYDALRNHEAEIDVRVMGIAASAASFIAMAGDSITMAKHSQMMIHPAQGVCIDSAAGMREFADLLDKHTLNIANIYASRTGKSADYFLEKMEGETWYDADEAVEEGLADEVDDYGDDAENSFDLTIYNYAGREAAPDPDIKGEAKPRSKPSNTSDTSQPTEAATEDDPWDIEAFRNVLKEATQ